MPAAAASRSSPAMAFAVAVIAIAIFSGMDAIMKGLVIAVGVYNAMLWRMLAGTVMSAPLYLRPGMGWPARGVMRLHVTRAAVSAVMGILFFWGLARIPIAQAIALAFIAPLIALFLAALLLGEQVTRRTILASLLAFAGVGIILAGQARSDPGEQAMWGALAVLGSALCYAWNLILLRQQSLVAGPSEVAFFQSLLVMALLALGAPFLAAPLPWELWPAVIAAAGCATVSLFLFAWAYARAEASYLAPSEYTAFLWAALFGWLVFGETVSPWTLAGGTLIIIGCAWAARRTDSAPVSDLEAQL